MLADNKLDDSAMIFQQNRGSSFENGDKMKNK